MELEAGMKCPTLLDDPGQNANRRIVQLTMAPNWRGARAYTAWPALTLLNSLTFLDATHSPLQPCCLGQENSFLSFALH